MVCLFCFFIIATCNINFRVLYVILACGHMYDMTKPLSLCVNKNFIISPCNIKYTIIYNNVQYTCTWTHGLHEEASVTTYIAT